MTSSARMRPHSCSPLILIPLTRFRAPVSLAPRTHRLPEYERGEISFPSARAPRACEFALGSHHERSPGVENHSFLWRGDHLGAWNKDHDEGLMSSHKPRTTGFGGVLVAACLLLMFLLEWLLSKVPSGSGSWENWWYVMLAFVASSCLVGIFLSFFWPGNLRDKLSLLGMATITWPAFALFLAVWVFRPGFVFAVVGVILWVAVVAWGWRRLRRRP